MIGGIGWWWLDGWLVVGWLVGWLGWLRFAFFLLTKLNQRGWGVAPSRRGCAGHSACGRAGEPASHPWQSNANVENVVESLRTYVRDEG